MTRRMLRAIALEQAVMAGGEIAAERGRRSRSCGARWRTACARC